jgi:hypothetical protein
MSKGSGDPTEAAPDLDAEGEARRRLLRLGLYTAPVVLGTLLLGRNVAAQVYPSCSPNKCRPATTPCSPSNCRPRG